MRSSSARQRSRRLIGVLTGLAVLIGAGCTMPPPPPGEYIDPTHPYVASETCRNADARQPYLGTQSCGQVDPVTFDDEMATMAAADDLWTAGDRAGAEALIHDVGYVPRAVDVYRPHGMTGPLPVVLYFHPGAWMFGDKTAADDTPTDPTFGGFGPELARRGYVVVAVDYDMSVMANIFKIVAANDGDPGEPSYCANVAVPHPGQPDVMNPQECYAALVSAIVSGACSYAECITAVRVMARANIDSYLSGEQVIGWVKDNAASLGVDPNKVFVSGEAGGAVTASHLTAQTWRVTGSAEATRNRVAGGFSVAGNEWGESSEIAAAAAYLNDPTQPDLGLGTWNEIGAVEASDPPFVAFVSEGDVLAPPAVAVHSMQVAQAHGANLRQYWMCGHNHAAAGADRALMFNRATTAMAGIMNGSPQLPDQWLGAHGPGQAPVGRPGAQPMVGTARVPLVGDFDGDGDSDVFFYGPGSTCDSLWADQTDPGQPGVHAFLPTNQPGVQIEGDYRPIVGDFDHSGADDILFHDPVNGNDTVWFDPLGPNGSRSDFSLGSGYAQAFAGHFGTGGPADDLYLLDRTSGAVGDDAIVWFPTRSTLSQSPLSPGFSPGDQPTPTDDVQPVVGDFNRDGRDDIAWNGPGATADGLWLGNDNPTGAGAPFTALPLAITSDSRAIAANVGGGDTSDQTPGPSGALDLLLASRSAGGATRLDYGVNSTGLAPPLSWTGFTPTAPTRVHPAVGDFDADGWDDVLWYGEGADADQIDYGRLNAPTSATSSFTASPFTLTGNLRPLTGAFDRQSGADVLWLPASEVAG